MEHGVSPAPRSIFWTPDNGGWCDPHQCKNPAHSCVVGCKESVGGGGLATVTALTAQ